MKLAAGPPVKIPPLKIQIKERIKPVMVRSRRFPPLHRDFIRKHISSLEEQNLMYRNPDSRWGSASRIAAKKDVGSYRMTVNLRAVRADNSNGVANDTFGSGSRKSRWITLLFFAGLFSLLLAGAAT